MAAGSIDYGRAATAVFYTRSLSPADAARADQVLAAAAPGLREDQLSRKAATLEMKLDPQAAKDRKERAAARDRRVEVRREASGNASLAGRELATADVMASKSYLDAIAARLRTAGIGGTLDHLRALALTELTQGRDPLVRLTPGPVPDAAAPAAPAAGTPPGPGTPAAGPDDPRPGAPAPEDPEPEDPEPEDSAPDPGAPPPRPRAPAPFPATINLIVPAGTLLGWSAAPARAGTWGLLDPDDTRDIVRAASRHPRTRWCYTFTGPDGTAIAHACAHGQHPWAPPPDPQPPPAGHGTDHSLSPVRAAQLLDLLRSLNADPEPIARGTCDHRHAEDRYTPSRKLQHLVRARTATCTAPGCNAQAVLADLDHTIPYPDGPTDECNLDPKCRRHHRVKQAPGWRVQQPAPGLMHWTTPSNRTHTTTPTSYDA
jgi:hypothetical protein